MLTSSIRRNKTRRLRSSRGLSNFPKQPIQNPSLQIGSGQFVPAMSRVSLRFSGTSDAKTSSLDLVQVSGNNVQDPLGSTGSGAPPGFSFWASMYERYRVLGSRCEAEFRISSDTKDASTITTAAKGILFPSNNTTSLATGSDYASQPFAKVVSFTTATPGRLVSTMSTSKILGQRDVLGPDRLQSVINTGPADEWFWRVCIAPDTDVSTNTYMIVTVTVTYDVEFFDRQPKDRSSVMAHFDAAYFENCKLIAESQKKHELERKAAASRLEKRIAEKEVRELKDDGGWDNADKPVRLSVAPSPASKLSISLPPRGVRHQ